MILRLEVNLPDLAFLSDLNVLSVVLAQRNIIVRWLSYLQHKLIELRLQLFILLGRLSLALFQFS